MATRGGRTAATTTALLLLALLSAVTTLVSAQGSRFTFPLQTRSEVRSLQRDALKACVAGSIFWTCLTWMACMCVYQSQECFLEEVDARASDNKILFRFGLLDPKGWDRMDVSVRCACSLSLSLCIPVMMTMS